MRKKNVQTEKESTKKRNRISRRGFLKFGGIALAGSVAAIYFGRTPLRRLAAEIIAESGFPHGINTLQPDLVFEMQADNTLLLKAAKVEMGQGIFTGLAMLVVEELDIPLEQVKVIPSSTAGGMIDTAGTSGSSTTSSLYQPIRETAATFREMLKLAAAKQWGGDISQVSTAAGFVSAGDQQMPYIDVVNSTMEWEIPDTPPLRPASSFKVVGTELPRIDLQPKVMGEPIYGLDVELPNMLHANVLKCPFIGGTLQNLEVAAAKAFPGVVEVIQLDDLVAVVAENRYAAEMGKRQINAEWTVPKIWQQQELDELVTVGTTSPVNIQREGNVNAQFDDGTGTLLEAEYRLPTGVHAHMEPNGAIADVQGDSTLIITGTQGPARVRNGVAQALGIDAENVEVQHVYLGGGFGRRFWLDPSPDAARISQMMGRPVHVLWDRETEFLCGVVRPSTHHTLRAKLDGAGRLTAVEHNVTSGEQGLGLIPTPFSVQPILGADLINVAHGASFVYAVENRDATIWHVDVPYDTGIWRAIGMYPNGFAIESFMDEVAHAAGQDPFDFRLAYLQGSDERPRRMRDLLQHLRAESGWDSPKAEGIGRGLAIVNDRRTVAASVIEVRVDDGKIRVVKVTSAIDPGVVINPEGVRMQVEGCVMMGIGAALYEETAVKDGQFTASNYHQYPMATLADTPAEINVIMLEGSDRPSGVGEPPLGPIAPAIANAIFDLTGHRLRQLPLQKALTAVI